MSDYALLIRPTGLPRLSIAGTRNRRIKNPVNTVRAGEWLRRSHRSSKRNLNDGKEILRRWLTLNLGHMVRMFIV